MRVPNSTIRLSGANSKKLQRGEAVATSPAPGRGYEGTQKLVDSTVRSDPCKQSENRGFPVSGHLQTLPGQHVRQQQPATGQPSNFHHLAAAASQQIQQQHRSMYSHALAENRGGGDTLGRFHSTRAPQPDSQMSTEQPEAKRPRLDQQQQRQNHQHNHQQQHQHPQALHHRISGGVSTSVRNASHNSPNVLPRSGNGQRHDHFVVQQSMNPSSASSRNSLDSASVAVSPNHTNAVGSNASMGSLQRQNNPGVTHARASNVHEQHRASENTGASVNKLPDLHGVSRPSTEKQQVPAVSSRWSSKPLPSQGQQPQANNIHGPNNAKKELADYF